MKINNYYEDANILYNDFKELTKSNILIKSRKKELVQLRALFAYILKKKLKLNSRQVSDWFKYKGHNYNRSSIDISTSKLETYYLDNDTFKDYYHAYFKEFKGSKFVKKFLNQKEINIENKRKREEDAKKDNLQLLIDRLPENRREEVFQIVNLRVKSWEWKSKDKCEVINCGESISSLVY